MRLEGKIADTASVRGGVAEVEAAPGPIEAQRLNTAPLTVAVSGGPSRR